METPGLEVGFLFRNVHDEVYSATQQRQEPYVYGTLSREPIYLKPALASPAPALSDAAQAWAAVKETNSPEVLKKFIESFGATVYGELARERLSNLDRSPILPARDDARAPLATPPAIARPDLQTDAAAPPNSVVAALPPVASPTTFTAASGRWFARMNCPIGSFNGYADFDVAADGSVVATANNGDRYTGRMSGNSISIQHRVDGGVVRAHLTLIASSNGRHSLDGTVIDSRLSFAPCSWHGAKH